SNSKNSTTLGQVIGFMPESMITLSARLAVNYLSIFLEKGGHLWMEGRADRGYGGLSTAFPDPPMFPAAFKYDMAPSLIDTSGVLSMPYKDLCVSVVDKIVGNFRVGVDMPQRIIENDGLAYIYRDTDDVFAAGFTSMPARIDLWEELTCLECFFNPENNPFIFVEIYNPEYWMEEMMIRPLECFHPLYRMRTAGWISPVDYATVAFIATKYSGKVPLVEDGVAVAANSYFFGLPLWYFDHGSIEQIADAIFLDWQIVAE
ncbi:MAG TPA: hypothetical protein VLA34_06310, partial [Candidatus Krumholzibacterium sp.]|nr:hypothetical protein [Candidatus Krumholzibacterium sp.]